MVARCQTPMNRPNSSTDTSAARILSPMSVSRRNGRSHALDLEAVDVVLGLCGIEGLAHDHECLGRRRGRGEAHFLHQLGGVRGQEALLGAAAITGLARERTTA